MNLTFKPRNDRRPVPQPTSEVFWPRLIAITGAAGSGKSTAAIHLMERRGYRRIRFADPIKDMLREFGLTFEQLDGALKETPSDLLCSRTARRAMQTLGDEWGRQLIGEDIWVRAWQRRIEEAAAFIPDVGIVCDDLRYPNELDAVLQNGGTVIRVIRPDAPTVEAHSSEDHHLFSQRVLVNDGTITDLARKLEAILQGLSTQQQAA